MCLAYSNTKCCLPKSQKMLLDTANFLLLFEMSKFDKLTIGYPASRPSPNFGEDESWYSSALENRENNHVFVFPTAVLLDAQRRHKSTTASKICVAQECRPCGKQRHIAHEIDRTIEWCTGLLARFSKSALFVERCFALW